jgi:hypothetical protein
MRPHHELGSATKRTEDRREEIRFEPDVPTEVRAIALRIPEALHRCATTGRGLTRFPNLYSPHSQQLTFPHLRDPHPHPSQ